MLGNSCALGTGGYFTWVGSGGGSCPRELGRKGKGHTKRARVQHDVPDIYLYTYRISVYIMREDEKTVNVEPIEIHMP
jgi:hypothetical protein